jgi:hypothetical protein
MTRKAPDLAVSEYHIPNLTPFDRGSSLTGNTSDSYPVSTRLDSQPGTPGRLITDFTDFLEFLPPDSEVISRLCHGQFLPNPSPFIVN